MHCKSYYALEARHRAAMLLFLVRGEEGSNIFKVVQ